MPGDGSARSRLACANAVAGSIAATTTAAAARARLGPRLTTHLANWALGVDRWKKFGRRRLGPKTALSAELLGVLTGRTGARPGSGRPWASQPRAHADQQPDDPDRDADVRERAGALSVSLR